MFVNFTHVSFMKMIICLQAHDMEHVNGDTTERNWHAWHIQNIFSKVMYENIYTRYNDNAYLYRALIHIELTCAS